MAPGLQIALTCVLTFGVPLGFAIGQLMVLRRPPRPKGGAPWRDDPPPPPTPKPLPDCLIPRPYAQPQEQRARQLEPA